MGKTQKGAWYGVLLSFLLAGIVVFDFLDTRVGWPIKLLVGIIWGGLLLGPVYLIERKKQSPGATMDERDEQIIKRALLASFASLAGLSGTAFVVAFLALGLNRTIAITMDEVSAVVYFVFVAYVLVLSLAVLVQYGREGKHEQ
jgi:hypothetical protein